MRTLDPQLSTLNSQPSTLNLQPSPLVPRPYPLAPRPRPATLPATDWDRYYRRPFRAARLTRKITAANLLGQIRRFVRPAPVIVELGGADSSFFDLIRRKIGPSQYHVLDNNQVGLDRFQQRVNGLTDVFLSNQDVLRLSYRVEADLVLSAGLIEHFGPEDTLAAVAAHFELLKPGGIAIVTFPTPTLLYRTTRRLAERAGLWMFPDERPLRLAEVAAAAGPHGRLLLQKLIWPIVLTQYLVVWRKR
jgi:SAM-dependent methyltransferase